MHLVAVNTGADVSGAEKVLVDLLRHAVSQGHSVTLVCPHGALPDLLAGKVTHVPVELKRLGLAKGMRRWWEIAGLPLTWWRASRTLRRISKNADALIANSTFALLPVAMAYPWHSRRKKATPWISWLVHDTIKMRKQRMALFLGGHALNLAVAVSEVTADSVRSSGIKVVARPNGVVVPEKMSGTTRTVQGHPVVGILAVLTAWKGQAILLEAIAQLPGVHLDIAGSAFPGSEEFETQIRARAAQPDLAGRVSFLGHVNRVDVFPRWDVMVSASTQPEAGPLNVLEAMADGVPVIATDHGGAEEYLRGGAGLLVKPGDATSLAEGIRELLEHPEKAARQREKARALVLERHNKEETLPKMLAALTGPGDLS